jgi:hypothetical protein
VFAANAVNGTLNYIGSMSVTGGVASNYSMASYSTSTSDPVTGVTVAQTADPAAAEYPCAMTWGTSAVRSIDLTGAPGTTVTGLAIIGGGTGGGTGIRSLGAYNRTSIAAPFVVSGFGTGLLANSGNLIANSIQVDTSGIGAEATAGAYLSCSPSSIERCSTDGLLATFSSGINASTTFLGFDGGASGYCVVSTVNSNTVTTKSNPAAGTAVPVYGCANSNAASPAFNTASAGCYNNQ